MLYEQVSVPAMESNSKECYCGSVSYQYLVFQSPRWGDNSKVSVFITKDELFKFPSPQWGVILKNIKQKVLQDLHATYPECAYDVADLVEREVEKGLKAIARAKL